MFGLTDYSKATWSQNFVASVAGAVASITVAAPLDTVKTRIQNANFEHKVSGVTVIRDLVRNEGPAALFKGLTPKVRSIAVLLGDTGEGVPYSSSSLYRSSLSARSSSSATPSRSRSSLGSPSTYERARRDPVMPVTTPHRLHTPHALRYY